MSKYVVVNCYSNPHFRMSDNDFVHIWHAVTGTLDSQARVPVACRRELVSKAKGGRPEAAPLHLIRARSERGELGVDPPLVRRPAPERDREPQRSYQVVLELVPASEVAVVEIILEVEPERRVAALTQREAEARPGGGAEV